VRRRPPQEVKLVPRTVGGDGAVHVCEHVMCKLPSEKWYEQGGGGKGAGGKGAAPPPRRR
jgi:hypothetical protein